MKLSKNYATSRFRSILIVSTFSLIVEYIVLLSHSIIVGWLLGSQALAALGIVTPLFSLIIFVAFIITNGTVVLSNFAVGRQDRDEANRFFSQGVILSISASIILTLVLYIFQQNIVSLFDVSPEIRGFVMEYFSVFLFLPIFQLFSTLLYCTVINEGGERLCTIASIVQIVTSIGVAIVLCAKIGIAGCAVAFLVTNFLSVLILCYHFLQKHCQVSFQWYISLKSVFSVLRYGAGDSMSFLYITVFATVMNIFLAARFGDTALIVFSVLLNFQTLMITGLDGIGQAIQPLVSVYYGENNLHGIKKTMRVAFAFTMIEGLTIMLLVLGFASYIPSVFGITEPGIVKQTAFALRVYSLSAVFWGVQMLLVTYFMYTAKLWLCHIISLALMLVCPLLLCLIVPAQWGLGAIWIAMALSILPATALSLLLIKNKSKKCTFPLLLERDELDRQFSCDGLANAQGVNDIMNKAEAEMLSRGIEQKTIYKVLLMIEEVSMLSIEKSGRKDFYIECTLMFDENISLILRDSGTYLDSTEDVAPYSMEEYMRRTIVSAQKNKKFAMSGGDNRTVFVFEK